MCFSYVCSVCACSDLSVSSSSWDLRRAAVCVCDTPWTFLLPFLPCVILFLCFSILLALRLPRLGKREPILVLFVRLFYLRLFGFVYFLFLLVSGKAAFFVTVVLPGRKVLGNCIDSRSLPSFLFRTVSSKNYCEGERGGWRLIIRQLRQ